jgi:ferredoxin
MKREYHAPSNYRVEYNEKTCIACGKCAGRCPINAIELKDHENPPQPKDGKKLKPKDLKKVVYHEDISASVAGSASTNARPRASGW